MRRFSAILAIFLLLWTVALAQQRSPREFAEGMLEDMLAAEGRSVSIDGLGIGLDGSVSIARAEVKDGETAWIALEGLSVAWRPLSLFDKQLAIDDVTVQRVVLNRIPTAPDSGVAAPKEFNRLTAAKVEKLRIGRLSIGKDVFGEQAELTVNGTLDVIADPPDIRLTLKADRVDGTRGAFDADVSLDPKSRNMKVDVALNEPGDGLVAHALRLRGGPAVSLALKAQGRFDDWKGTADLSLDNKSVFSGDASAQRSLDGVSVAIKGKGEAGPFVPEQLAPLLGGSSDLSASLTFPNASSLMNVEAFDVANSKLTLTAKGPVAWQGRGTTLDLLLTSAQPDSLLELAGVQAQGAMIELTVTGDLADPRWSANIRAQKFVTPYGELQNGTVAAAGRGWGIGTEGARLNVTAKGVLASEQLPPALNGLGEFVLAAERETDGRVKLDQFALMLGHVAFQSTGYAAPEPGSVALDISGSSVSPKTGNAVIDTLVAGAVKLSGHVVTEGVSGVVLNGFALESKAIMVKADGRIDDKAADLGVTFEARDLSLIDPGLKGKASGKATLKGPRDALQAQVDATATGMTLMKRPFENARLSATLTLSGNAPTGSIKMTGRLQGQDVSLDAKADLLADGARVLRDFRFMSGSSQITGEVRLGRGGVPSGSLSITSPDLRDIGPFLLLELSGQANAEATLKEDDGGLAEIAFDARRLKTPWLSAAEANGRVTVTSPFSSPVPNGTARFKDVKISDLSFDTLELDVIGKSASNYDVSMRTRGDVKLDMRFDVRTQDGRRVLQFRRLEGAYRGMAFVSAGPVVMRQSERGVALEKGQFKVGKGRVDLSGAFSPKLDLTAKVEALPLPLVQDIVRLPHLEGVVSGQAKLAGDPSDPAVSFAMTGKDVRFQQMSAQGLPPVSLKADGTLKNGALTFKATADAGKGTQITASGTASAQSLDVALKGKVDADFLARRLLDQGVRLEAQPRFEVKVSGTPSAPRYDGTVSVGKATVGDTAGKLIIRDAGGTARINNNLVQIERLSGRAGKSGTARLSGTLQLNETFDTNLSLNIQDGIYSDGSFVLARYDAALTLTGPLPSGAQLGGEIVLRKASVTLSAIPKSALSAPEIKHRNPPVPVARQAQILAERRPRASGNLRLNVRIKAAQPISVTGRGLNVALGGQLLLAGPFNQISPQGAFRLQRGSMKFLVRTLEFESGRLDFNDGFDPRIDFRAVSRQADATISLAVTGRASEPDISVTSSPQMPEEEALARLVFDRSMLQLSPLQIAQIASYVATLSGGRDTGLLTGLQNALGADWLDVIQTETGEAAVGVGKRINSRLSVGVEQTTRTNTSRVTIDLDVSKNVKLRGSYGTDRRSRAGVFFEKDY